MAFQITPEYIKALRQHLEDKNFSGLESLLLDLHAADVAEIAQSLDADQAFALMQTLGSERFSDVIVYFDEERRGEILENFTGKEIAQVVVDNMDDAAVEALLRRMGRVAQRIDLQVFQVTSSLVAASEAA